MRLGCEPNPHSMPALIDAILPSDVTFLVHPLLPTVWLQGGYVADAR